MPLVHHEICFGCGRNNLFGLMLETEREDGDVVAGRFFVKQDHQGAEPGKAHEGVLVAALSEAMALACGPTARARTVEVQVSGQAPVGAFVEVRAQVQRAEDGLARASAEASCEGEPVARASGAFQP